jgi:hypothetical protein
MAESNSPQDATPSTTPDDDNKRKFREALDRKMAKSSGGSDHKDGGGGKQSPTHGHGPAESRREFRRKAGG